MNSERRNTVNEDTVELSVIIATLDRFDTVQKVIQVLQSEKCSLEILLAVPDCKRFGLDEAQVSGPHEVRVIELGEIYTAGQARATAVRESKGAVIAFVEEHSLPAPGWARAMIEAHHHPCAAVGPAMTNANPETMISWAELFLSFGSWVAPVENGFVKSLPWHNTSYKRNFLEAYGVHLADALEAEAWVQWDLIAQGQRLYLTEEAKTNHLNVSRLFPFVRANFYGGRLFGSVRAHYFRWSIFHRIAYAAGSCLIPLVRFTRVLRQITRTGMHRTIMPRVLAPLWIGLAAHALGEGIGYALGRGKSREKRCDLELRRRCYLSARDKEAKIYN